MAKDERQQGGHADLGKNRSGAKDLEDIFFMTQIFRNTLNLEARNVYAIQKKTAKK
jgi:hypothetical protein